MGVLQGDIGRPAPGIPLMEALREKLRDAGRVATTASTTEPHVVTAADANQSWDTKTTLMKWLVAIRNWRSRALFKHLSTYCRGEVCDVGGWDFYSSVVKEDIRFTSWTTVEPSRAIPPVDERHRVVRADGCDLPFEKDSFDTVTSIQVLEHVYEPNLMFSELVRVLRPGGCLVVLVPQTSVMHHAPDHFYNFTRYWVRESARRHHLEIVEEHPLGGRWSSTASHMFHFFLQAGRFRGMSMPEDVRGPMFYVMFPFMCLYAALSIPILMLFALGDLREEPNNLLVVMRK